MRVMLQVFQVNMVKAWGAVLTTLVSVSASLYLISVSPLYLLPFAWFIAGTAFTGVRGNGPTLWCCKTNRVQVMLSLYPCGDNPAGTVVIGRCTCAKCVVKES
jgi:hypothetical protein